MAKDEHMVELDRNMDVVFDAVRVLNSAMSAMAASLGPEAAAAFVQHMDEAIDDLEREPAPLSLSARHQIHSWRNRAGLLAGLPVRRPN